MTIPVQCTACAQKFDAPDASAGKSGKCPACGAPITVAVVSSDNALGLEPLAEAPLADLLDEEVSGGAPLAAAPDPLGRPKKSRISRPRPERRTRAAGEGNPLARHALALAVLVVAVIVFVVADMSQVANRMRLSETAGAVVGHVPKVLGVLGVLLAVHGFLLRKRNLSYQKNNAVEEHGGMVLGGLLLAVIAIAVIALWLRVISVYNSEHVVNFTTWKAFEACFMIGLVYAIPVGLILLFMGAAERYGFFRSAAWFYVVLLGVLPLISIVSKVQISRPLEYASSKSYGGRGDEDQPKPPPPPPRPATSDPASRQPTNVPTRKPGSGGTNSTPKIEDIPWTASPDPAPEPSAKIAHQAIPLGAEISKIKQVVLRDAAVAVLVDEGGGQKLISFDLATGERGGESRFAGKVGVLDISADGGKVLISDDRDLAVWSLKTGDELARWPLAGSGRPRSGHLLADDIVAVVDAGRNLVAWRESHLDKPLYTVERVQAAAASPGGKQLALFNSSSSSGPLGDLVDATNGKKLGQLARPLSVRSLTSPQAAFNHDGSRLAVASSGKLLAWRMEDGAEAAAFSNVYSSGLLAFIDREHVLYGGEVYHLGREAKVVELSLAGGWRVAAMHPTGAAWLPAATGYSAPAFLLPLDVRELITNAPPTTGDAPTIRIQASQLLAAHGVVAGGASDPGGTAATPPLSVATSPNAGDTQSAMRNHYIDLLAGEPAAIKSRLRWWPGAKTPTIGLRWGVGVYYSGKTAQPQVASLSQLGRVTGPLGGMFIAALQERIGQKKFGDWSGADRRLQEVVLLGAGKQSDLMDEARAQGLDAIAVFLLADKRIGLSGKTDTELRVRVVDLAGRQSPWSSTTLSSNRLAAAGQGAEALVEQFVASVFEHVDQNMTLGPMPTVTGEQAAARAQSLTQTPPDEPLPVLAELRCYHAQGLLDDEEAARRYDALLGAGKGRTLVKGDAAARNEVLQEWISSAP